MASLAWLLLCCCWKSYCCTMGMVSSAENLTLVCRCLLFDSFSWISGINRWEFLGDQELLSEKTQIQMFPRLENHKGFRSGVSAWSFLIVVSEQIHLCCTVSAEGLHIVWQMSYSIRYKEVNKCCRLLLLLSIHSKFPSCSQKLWLSLHRGETRLWNRSCAGQSHNSCTLFFNLTTSKPCWHKICTPIFWF